MRTTPSISGLGIDNYRPEKNPTTQARTYKHPRSSSLKGHVLGGVPYVLKVALSV